jgi:hypothetical protein
MNELEGPRNKLIGLIGSLGKWGLFLSSVFGIGASLVVMLGLAGYVGLPETPGALLLITLPLLYPLVYSCLSLCATLRTMRNRNLIAMGILLNLPVLALMILSIVQNREMNLVGVVCLGYIFLWTAFILGRVSQRD